MYAKANVKLEGIGMEKLASVIVPILK